MNNGTKQIINKCKRGVKGISIMDDSFDADVREKMVNFFFYIHNILLLTYTLSNL